MNKKFNYLSCILFSLNSFIRLLLYFYIHKYNKAISLVLNTAGESL